MVFANGTLTLKSVFLSRATNECAKFDVEKYLYLCELISLVFIEYFHIQVMYGSDPKPGGDPSVQIYRLDDTCLASIGGRLQR